MELPLPFDSLLVLAVGVVFLLILVAVTGFWIVLRRKPVRLPPKPPDRSINVATFDASGAAADQPQLEYYGCPVRLAVLIVAPVGRAGSIPEKELLPELFEQFVPQFLQVVAAHQPQLQFWPAQISVAGFTNSFFGKIALPGDRGKGTPWCALAGRFTAMGGHYLAGIVCCGDNASGLGQLVIEQEGQWRDVLRVKN
jgi:hypothetical protein